MSRPQYDAIVVGGGPNGLAAANLLADADLSVLVMEAAPVLGGGSRSDALTRPGFVHDICSAIHPLGVASPYFRSLDLERYGLRWRFPPLGLAHPFDDGTAAVLETSLERTAAGLGADGPSYHQLMAPFVRRWEALFADTLRAIRLPRHPLLLARFARVGLQSCDGVVHSSFEGRDARALFAGVAAHSVLALDEPGSAAFGLMLSVAGHAVGWPCAEGGSQSIVEALAARASERGVEVRTSAPVRALRELPTSRVVLLSLTPRQVLSVAGDALPGMYSRGLGRFVYGAGVFKIDWALDGPIPFESDACRSAGTVHLGGDYEELFEAQRDLERGRHSAAPFVLVGQQSLFDPTRAPTGHHTGWAYCHVPHGSTVDMTEAVEAQVERFAPGFRARILARHVMNTADLEAHNANMIGGDIGGGRNHLAQFLVRPVARLDPYTTPNPRLFLCSSSTPPGGGVHGMCGYWAARSVLRRLAVDEPLLGE